MNIQSHTLIRKSLYGIVILALLLAAPGSHPVTSARAQEAGTEMPAPSDTATPQPSDTPVPTETPAPIFRPSVELTPTASLQETLDFSAAGNGTLFRARVTLKQPADLSRLQKWGITVLASSGGTAYVLVDETQLAKLARLGFAPFEINSLDYMATVYAALNAGSDVSSDMLAASPDFLMSLASVDTDQDGLTDTEEAWWCTDPLDTNSDFAGDPTPKDPNDGDEVQNILKGIRAYGPPFAMWPDFRPYHPDGACPDGDFDGVPDNAELYMIGTSPMRESSDLDKFDDGQELFGVTFCPGANGPCGYGILPRAEDVAWVSANLPAWVKSPGDSPFVAAFPEPEVEVVPSSIKMTQVTVITNTKGTTEGTEKTYGTSSTKGTSTSIANQITWNSWQEVSVATQGVYAVTEIIPSFVEPHQSSITWSSGLHITGNVLQIAGAVGGAIAVCGATGGLMCGLAIAGVAGPVVSLAGDIVDTLQKDAKVNSCTGSCSPSGVKTQTNQQIVDKQKATTNTGDFARGGTGTTYSQEANSTTTIQPYYQMSYPVPLPITTTQGTSRGGSQTTTTTQYEEQTISESSTNQYSDNWSTATAVDSSHAADLRFTYHIVNDGTEYAREVSSLTFNIYIGSDPNPVYTYCAVGATSSCQLPTVSNLFPGDSLTYTSNPVALTLDEMRLLDEGAPIRVVMEDLSFGQDEAFYLDAINGSVTVAMEDGYDDLDETVDMYLIPVWDPSDTLQDVVKRYFPAVEDEDGNLLAIFTPEVKSAIPEGCKEDENIAPRSNTFVFCKHALTGTSWWNFYLSDGLDYTGAFQDTLAAPNTTMLVRIVSDRDLDGYNDRNEIRLGTDPDDPADHPSPNLLAGYTKSCSGDDCTLRMTLQNLGNYDAYGVEAVLYSPDGLSTITNNTIGGSGRVAAGAKVVVSDSDTFQYTIADPNYTEPVIVVSYNDPQGNHRFILPANGLLTDLNADLAFLDGRMLPDPGVDIASTSSTQANFVLNSPHDQPITGGKLFVEYIDSQGDVAHEDVFTQDFQPGPTVVPVTIDLDTYPADEYILLAFFTDSQGNIIDSSARPLASFGADPLPEASLTAGDWKVGVLSLVSVPDPWNFGVVQPGTTLHAPLNLANTGLGDLRYALTGLGSGLSLSSGSPAGTLGPSATRAFNLALDTSGMAAGPFSRTLTLRTSDPNHGSIAIHITGTISDYSIPAPGSASAYAISEYRPWDQMVYVPGPHSQNNIVTFTHTLTDDPSRMFPLYLYSEDGSTLKGVGEYGVDFSGQTSPFDVFGDGRNGDLIVPSGQTVYLPDIRFYLVTRAESGQPNVVLNWYGNYTIGQEVMVFQTQGTGAGNYEFGKIVRISDTTLTLNHDLIHTYEVGGNSNAQVVSIPQYHDVTVQSGGTLSFWGWFDNALSIGGVLAFKANGTVTINGMIDMTGKGFRGTPTDWGHNLDGKQGEGQLGGYNSTRSNNRNGSGGGGGIGQQASAGGGGGGNVTVGQDGQPKDGHVGGSGGYATGSSVPENILLLDNILPGGGGGQGGLDDDGDYSGAGGSGGGIIMIFARSLTISGAISANGVRGGDGSNPSTKNGMGGGGGGAGGSIFIASRDVNLGTNGVNALGGVGGNPGGGYGGVGGSGSDGRILIAYGTITGTTNPAANTQQVNYYNMTGTNPTSLYLPEAIASGNYLRYYLKYGQRSSNTNCGDQLFSVQLPNRQFNSVTLSNLIERVEGSLPTFIFKLDVGNNGSWDWEPTSQSFNNPVQLNSENLASAFNAYITEQQSSAEELDIPIRVNITSPAYVFLFNLVSLVGQDIDLQPASLTIAPQNGNPPSNIPEGTLVDLNATVKNNGAYKAENFTVAFYLGDPDTGGTLIGSKFIESLAGGATTMVEPVVWNTSGLLGDKTIYVKVDASNPPNGAVPESNENNNVTSAPATVKMKPDLVAVSLTLPDLRAGETGTASAVIKNQGQADVSGAVVRLYNGTPESGAALGSTTVDVAQDGQVTANINFSLPAAGQYDLTVKADPTNLIAEADESNNAASSTAHIGWDKLTVDAGGANDIKYIYATETTPSSGYGWLTQGTTSPPSCGTAIQQSYRQVGSAETLSYRFDNLLPSRSYHLDLTFLTCSGTRSMNLSVDGRPVYENGLPQTNSVNASPTPQTVSILLDPADYADGTVTLSIRRASGLSGPLVNILDLQEIRYCSLDSGPAEAAWSTTNNCGYDPAWDSDGFDGWGSAPEQTMRFSETGSVKYKFTNLDAARKYNLRLTFFSGDGVSRAQQLSYDGLASGSYTAGGVASRILELFPAASYADGSVALTVQRSGAGEAIVNEVTIEENTRLENDRYPEASALIPGAFVKTSPGNGDPSQPLDPALTWGASSNASGYEYCIDASNNAACDANWISTGVAQSAALSGLTPGSNYYWQARALNASGFTYADGGTWWSFSTPPLPGTFAKIAPADGAANQLPNLSLTWGPSSNASSYAYCVDTSNDGACDAEAWVSTGAAQTAAPASLVPGATYYWQVRASNTSGATYANSGAWRSFTTGSAPTAFTKDSPFNGVKNKPLSLTLYWNASSGATSYEYCYDTTNNDACDGSWVNRGTARSAALSGLTAGTTYYWQARAVNSFGATYANGGAWWSFTTLTLPGAFFKSSPKGVVAGSLTPTLSWTTSSNTAGYEYCVDTSNDTVCDNAWVYAGMARSVSISSLLPGLTYYWQVRARNAAGATYADGDVWASFATLPLPGAFTRLKPANAATKLPLSGSLTWAASSNVARYEYCLDTSNDTVCDTGWVSTGTSRSAALSDLLPGVTYYWQVRARNTSGDTYASGGVWGSFATLPLPGAFSKLKPAAEATKLPLSGTLTWAASSNGSGYEYCIDTTNDTVCDTGWVSTGASRTATLSGLTAGATYYWQVRARNTSGETYANGGAWWSFTTAPASAAWLERKKAQPVIA